MRIGGRGDGLSGRRTAHPVVSVTVSFDDAPFLEVEPDTVWFDTWDDAAPAVARALALEPGAGVFVAWETPDHFDHEEDPDLDDWPAARHIRRHAR